MDIMQYEEDVKNRNCMHQWVDLQQDDETGKMYATCEDCGVDMQQDALDNDYYRYLLSEGPAEDFLP